METPEKPEVKPDPTPEELEAIRIRKLPPHEREVYEGKLLQLKEENETLKKQLDEKNKPEPKPKKKGLLDHLDDFNPLT